jgi:hypothetical protein
MIEMIQYWLPIVALTVPMFFFDCGPCNCGCTGCTTAQPERVQVEFFAFLDTPTCGSCLDLNTTWVLERSTATSGKCAGGAAAGRGCFWVYEDFDSDFCPEFYSPGVSVVLSADGLADPNTSIFIEQCFWTGSSWDNISLFLETPYTAENCGAWAGRSVAPNSTPVCNYLGADPEITAL